MSQGEMQTAGGHCALSPIALAAVTRILLFLCGYYIDDLNGRDQNLVSGVGAG